MSSRAEKTQVECRLMDSVNVEGCDWYLLWQAAVKPVTWTSWTHESQIHVQEIRGTCKPISSTHSTKIKGYSSKTVAGSFPDLALCSFFLSYWLLHKRWSIGSPPGSWWGTYHLYRSASSFLRLYNVLLLHRVLQFECQAWGFVVLLKSVLRSWIKQSLLKHFFHYA